MHICKKSSTFAADLNKRPKMKIAFTTELPKEGFQRLAERGFGDVDELQSGLHRGGLPLAALGEVLHARARGLGHLVELAPARVVFKREEPTAEHERLKLNDVHQNVDIKPLVTRGVLEKLCRHKTSLACGNALHSRRCPIAVDCCRLLSHFDCCCFFCFRLPSIAVAFKPLSIAFDSYRPLSIDCVRLLSIALDHNRPHCRNAPRLLGGQADDAEAEVLAAIIVCQSRIRTYTYTRC